MFSTYNSIFGNMMSCLSNHGPWGPQGPPDQFSIISRPHISLLGPPANYANPCFLTRGNMNISNYPALADQENPDGSIL